ncbi:SCO3374 family protein [Streptomyces bungoensis]|uniref:SCO3374 family protein n=1 Tax=Streptomyces bungoensis TaxID=285568 RepID=UPI003F4D6A1B
MAGSVPTTPAVPLPRRPLDPVAPGHRDGPDARARYWYENDLGWPTVPGRPLRLLTGVRFDVLDVPAEAGAGAFRHLAPGSPVALRGDRMLLLVAAGSAEVLPEVLDWLEWGAGALALDLRALGAGDAMEAPVPPAALLPPPRRPGSACCRSTSPFRAVPDGGTADHGRERAESGGEGPDFLEGAAGVAEAVARIAGRAAGIAEGVSVFAGYGADSALGGGDSPGSRVGRTGGGRDSVGVCAGCAGDAADSAVGGRESAGRGARSAGGGADSVSGSSPESGAGRAGFGAGSVQGAAVWLRPPEPGGEAEASLPALPAMGGSKGGPDLVRLVDTVAARCHRIRLRRASARPSARRRDQPLAFS